MSNKNTPVTKAVIPVAGLGTRFLPATRSVPKILLPVLNVPVIDYAVREAVASGITDIALVMSRGMESVAEYFSAMPKLVEALGSRGNHELAEKQREIASLAKVVIRYQDDPKGLGHAVLMAEDFVDGEPFVVMLPDDVIWADIPATKQLLNVRDAHGGSVLAALEVPDDVVPKKGILDGHEVEPGVFSVKGMVEKPKLEDAPSNLSIIGRYVLENKVFEFLSREQRGAGGEIQLTDAIEYTIGDLPVHGCRFQGRHADTGNPGGMLDAALYEAGKDPALRELVKAAIAEWK
jgi:UTP--glucose-1-phosphate uridylyltransferase